MDVYDRIDKLLKEKGISRRKAAQMAGIIPGTLNSALYRKKGLSASAVANLAQALGVDATYLLYGEMPPFFRDTDNESDLPRTEPPQLDEKTIAVTKRHIQLVQEREGFMNAYDALNDKGKGKIHGYMEGLIEQQQYLKSGYKPLEKKEE